MAENEDVDGPPKRSTRVLYLLARQADLLKALANRKGRTEEVDNRRAEMAARAEDRLTAYFSECLAHGADQAARKKLAPDLQKQFDAVSKIIDRHSAQGGVDTRRNLLQQAEQFVTFSRHNRSTDETNDYESIAGELNAAASRPFGQKGAETFIEKLGHLHQTVRDHVRTRNAIFVDQYRDPVDWQVSGDVGIRVKAIDARLQALGSDPTLERFESLYRERLEAAKTAASDRDVSPASEQSVTKPAGTEEPVRAAAGSKRERSPDVEALPEAKRQRIIPRPSVARADRQRDGRGR